MSLKYGIELDDIALTMLAIILAEQKKLFAEQLNKLEQIKGKSGTATKSLQTDPQKPGWQAFWFGMGQFGLALIFCLLVLCGIYLYNQYNNRQSILLQWYQSYYRASQNGNREAVNNFLKQNPKPDNP